jgi:metallophosphoesterase superfamily enzyme
MAAFAAWHAARPSLRLTLVRGNHDERAGDPPAELGIEVVDEPQARGPWALCHHPRPREGAKVLAGHIHPGAVVGGAGFDRLCLPAFHLDHDVLVLPAFGEFTGLKTVTREAGDRCFVTDGSRVLQVP